MYLTMTRGSVLTQTLTILSLLIILCASLYFFYSNFYVIPKLKVDMINFSNDIYEVEKAWFLKHRDFFPFGNKNMDSAFKKLGIKRMEGLLCRVVKSSSKELAIYIYPDKKRLIEGYDPPFVYVYQVSDGIEKRGFLSEAGTIQSE